MIGQFTELKYDDIRTPITSFYVELNNNRFPDWTSENFYYGAGYVGLTICIGSLLGFILHKIVRLLRLDVYFPVLRFANHWNYYFRGDLPHLRSNQTKGRVISTNLDVIIEDGTGKTHLYSGFLSHYTISQTTGELDTLVISNTERWSESAKKFKPIPGDSLIIPYKTVINLNLRYNVKKSKTRTQKIATTIGVFAILSFGAIFFCIPYYYYDTIGTFKTIIALLLSWSIWLFSTSLLFQLFNLDGNNTSSHSSSKKQIIVSTVIIIFILSSILYCIVS